MRQEFYEQKNFCGKKQINDSIQSSITSLRISPKTLSLDTNLFPKPLHAYFAIILCVREMTSDDRYHKYSPEMGLSQDKENFMGEGLVILSQ
jgi:hypothetical protein